MKLVVNRTTGTKHLPGEETTTLCGRALVRDGKENATWEESAWLDDWPEDFGITMDDCATCAKMMEQNREEAEI